jgi:hypothetical protein
MISTEKFFQVQFFIELGKIFQIGRNWKIHIVLFHILYLRWKYSKYKTESGKNGTNIHIILCMTALISISLFLGILSIYRKILLENKSFNREGVANELKLCF